jgi:SAM-dependent methyltransferase
MMAVTFFKKKGSVSGYLIKTTMMKGMSLSGIQRILSNPSVYHCMSSLLWGPRSYGIFVHDYIRPRSGDKVLDIGCGTADIVEFLPPVDYQGFDQSEEYIASARKRFSGRGSFFCRPVGRDAVPGKDIFDIILACGVIHHLDDEKATEMFELAHTLLKSGGRLITLDGVYMPDQSYLVHLLLSGDRGKYVRSQEQYCRIARTFFTDISVSIRSDLLRLPYTHIIMECGK